MTQYAFIVDALRTPFGRYGGSLSSIRADDLGAVPLKALMALMARHPNLKWQAVIDVIYGCANQAGEDSRNVARTQRCQAEGSQPDRGGYSHPERPSDAARNSTKAVMRRAFWWRWG